MKKSLAFNLSQYLKTVQGRATVLALSILMLMLSFSSFSKDTYGSVALLEGQNTEFYGDYNLHKLGGKVRFLIRLDGGKKYVFSTMGYYSDRVAFYDSVEAEAFKGEPAPFCQIQRVMQGIKHIPFERLPSAEDLAQDSAILLTPSYSGEYQVYAVCSESNPSLGGLGHAMVSYIEVAPNFTQSKRAGEEWFSTLRIEGGSTQTIDSNTRLDFDEKGQILLNSAIERLSDSEMFRIDFPKHSAIDVLLSWKGAGRLSFDVTSMDMRAVHLNTGETFATTVEVGESTSEFVTIHSDDVLGWYELKLTLRTKPTQSGSIQEARTADVY